jgi:hypothetical protein
MFSQFAARNQVGVSHCWMEQRMVNHLCDLMDRIVHILEFMFA